MASHNFMRTDFPFPPELVHEIVNLLPRSLADLRNLAFVSRNMRDVVHSIILRRISIPDRRRGNHVPFLDAVLAAPNRIGAYVRKYNYCSFGAREKSNEEITHALHLMVHLKHLKWCDWHWDPKHLGTFQAWQVRLTSLHWTPRVDDPEDDPLFKVILPAQHQLMHLVIETLDCVVTDAMRSTAEGLCPNLESLGGQRAVTELFIKGRKITYLKWFPEDEKNQEKYFDEKQYEDEFEKLQYLEYAASEERWTRYSVGIPLPRIAKYLKNVRVLTVDTVNVEVKQNYYDAGPHWPHSVYNELKKLETLQIKMNPDIPHRNPTADKQIVPSIFSHCDSLQRVYAEMIKNNVYLKYTDGSADGMEFVLKAEYVYDREMMWWDNYATRDLGYYYD